MHNQSINNTLIQLTLAKFDNWTITHLVVALQSTVTPENASLHARAVRIWTKAHAEWTSYDNPQWISQAIVWSLHNRGYWVSVPTFATLWIGRSSWMCGIPSQRNESISGGKLLWHHNPGNHQRQRVYRFHRLWPLKFFLVASLPLCSVTSNRWLICGHYPVQ